MQIYLPIAELSVNVLVLLSLGGTVGFLSGMFGVGGGFLMTPLLIFLGIPPAVAVATEANQIVASSVSGVISHWRRRNVDFKIGGLLLAGGVLGSVCGVALFRILRTQGQIDIAISLLYVVFLGTIGSLMLNESLRSMKVAREGGRPMRRKPGQHNWVHGLPFRMRFPRSKIYISAIPVLVLGFFAEEAVPSSPPLLLGVGGYRAPVTTARLRVRSSPGPGPLGLLLDPQDGLRHVDLFDLRGRRVRSLEVGSQIALVEWDGRDETGGRVASGRYIAVLREEPATRTSLVLVR